MANFGNPEIVLRRMYMGHQKKYNWLPLRI